MRKAAQLHGWALGALALALMTLSGWSQGPDKEAPVKLTVRVPDPKATLTVDGTLTKQTGPERLFESPALVPGKTFHYTLKITWMADGKEKSETRKVKVQAGKNVTVDFTKPAPGTTTKDKAMKDMAKKDVVKKDVVKTDKATKDKALPPPDLGPKADKKTLPDTGKTTDKANGAKDRKTPVKDAPLKDAPLKDAPDKGASAPRTREFLFTYAATLTGLTPGQEARVWLPVPPSNEFQRVRAVPQTQPFRGRTRQGA